MIKRMNNSHKHPFYGYLLSFFIGTIVLSTQIPSEVDAIDFAGSHLGTFEGQTTYQVSSETVVIPTLELELKNHDGSSEHYKTSSGTLDLTNTKQGATVKRAILKGQTLTNLNQTTYPVQTWKANTNLNNYYHDEMTLAYINPTTKYLFKIFGLPNPTEIQFEGITTLFKSVNNNYHFNQNGAIIMLSTESVSKMTRFTPHFKRLNVNNLTPEEMDNFKMIIVEYQDGMENLNIPYFETIHSTEMPTLTISNQDHSQSTTISFEEDVVLRSNGDVYDELDLMTGKLTQRIGENGEVLSTPKIRTLIIKADSIFESVKEAEVDMVGTIESTIASITLPTAPLTFKINPNLPSDQQFIASDFSITNNSQAPLTLELKEFVQTTDVLEDVHPDFYENWENLTKDQSKKIALGLVPQDSENWLTLQAGPYYVSETQNALLGHIKSNSTVDFTFTALHGQSFNQLPNPQYRLTFVFGF